MSPESGSVAATGSPMSCPAAAFSATLRVVEVESNAGGSFAFVTAIVTSMESLAPSLSSATTVTE